MIPTRIVLESCPFVVTQSHLDKFEHKIVVRLEKENVLIIDYVAMEAVNRNSSRWMGFPDESECEPCIYDWILVLRELSLLDHLRTFSMSEYNITCSLSKKNMKGKVLFQGEEMKLSHALESIADNEMEGTALGIVDVVGKSVLVLLSEPKMPDISNLSNEELVCIQNRKTNTCPHGGVVPAMTLIPIELWASILLFVQITDRKKLQREIEYSDASAYIIDVDLYELITSCSVRKVPTSDIREYLIPLCDNSFIELVLAQIERIQDD